MFPYRNFSLDTFNTIDRKAFHVSSRVPAGISDGLSLNETCRSSMTLLILFMTVKLPNWHFVFLDSTPHASCGNRFDHIMVSTAVVSSHQPLCSESLRCPCLNIECIMEFLWIFSCFKSVLVMNSWCSVLTDSMVICLSRSKLIRNIWSNIMWLVGSSVKVSKKSDFVCTRFSWS